jgi:hypothetical protein
MPDFCKTALHFLCQNETGVRQLSLMKTGRTKCQAEAAILRSAQRLSFSSKAEGERG